MFGKKIGQKDIEIDELKIKLLPSNQSISAKVKKVKHIKKFLKK